MRRRFRILSLFTFSAALFTFPLTPRWNCATVTEGAVPIAQHVERHRSISIDPLRVPVLSAKACPLFGPVAFLSSRPVREFPSGATMVFVDERGRIRTKNATTGNG